MRISDWRSDVCSSDLGEPAEQPVQLRQPIVDVADALVGGLDDLPHQMIQLLAHLAAVARDLVAEVQQADMLDHLVGQIVEAADECIRYVNERLAELKIGRASCRERVCQYV